MADEKDDDVKQERELREQWQEHHLARHDLEEQARQLATGHLERRLDALNEVREQINSERGEFVRRDYYEQKHHALWEQMDARMKLLENTISNYQGRMWAFGAAITAIVVLVNVLLRLLK